MSLYNESSIADEDEPSLGLFSPLTVGEDFWEAGRGDVVAIIGHVGLESGSRVLVIPRGAGQHAVAFAERGMEVTTVGPPGAALELARGRAEELDLEIEFVDEQSVDFEPDSFDLVVNLSSSFDFVQAGEDPAAALGSVQRALSSGGRLVLRMVNMNSDERRVKPRNWTESAGLLVLEELEYSWDIGWVSYRWLIVTPDGRRYEFHLGHQGYDSRALLKTVGEAGFEEVTVHGSLAGDPFESDTPLVIYARK